jgi:hypothetical protein
MIEFWILLNLYACVSGTKDAILYCKKATESFKWNEHIVFFIERSIVCSIPIITLYFNISLANITWCLLAFVLSFSFFHNGFYYETRRKIDVPTYRWNSNSKESSAKLELNFVVRTFLLTLAVIILLTKLLLHEL